MCSSDLNSITDKNDDRDGEIFIKANYGTRTIKVTILIEKNGDLFEFKKWIGKKHQQLFEWDGDDEYKAIWVILSDKVESQVYYQDKFYAKFDLTFVAHNPYYFINKKENIIFNDLTEGTKRNIGYQGNCDSYPLLIITPITNNIAFTFNELNISLKDY